MKIIDLTFFSGVEEHAQKIESTKNENIVPNLYSIN